jgi:hypothetical protein
MILYLEVWKGMYRIHGGISSVLLEKMLRDVIIGEK